MTNRHFFYFMLACLFAASVPKIKAASGDYWTGGYDSANGRDVLRLNSSGNLVPGANNTYALGTSALAFSDLQAVTATFSGTITSAGVTSSSNVATTGSIGAGTATPDAKLEVQAAGSGGSPNLTVAISSADGTRQMSILKDGSVQIGSGTVTAGPFVVVPPATQVIASGNTIAANACGTLKRISSASAVTTDTTNTITAPSAANEFCAMTICNMNASDAITLDKNSLILLTGGADVALAAQACINVVQHNGVWRQTTAALAGT